MSSMSTASGSCQCGCGRCTRITAAHEASNDRAGRCIACARRLARRGRRERPRATGLHARTRPAAHDAAASGAQRVSGIPRRAQAVEQRRARGSVGTAGLRGVPAGRFARRRALGTQLRQHFSAGFARRRRRRRRCDGRALVAAPDNFVVVVRGAGAGATPPATAAAVIAGARHDSSRCAPAATAGSLARARARRIRMRGWVEFAYVEQRSREHSIDCAPRTHHGWGERPLEASGLGLNEMRQKAEQCRGKTILQYCKM